MLPTLMPAMLAKAPSPPSEFLFDAVSGASTATVVYSLGMLNATISPITAA